MSLKSQPPTETMKISDVKQQLNRLANNVYRGESRILVEKIGIPVAALISPRDLEMIAHYEAQRAADFAAIYELADGFAGESPEEIQRQTDLAVAEVRAEMRAERAAAAAAAIQVTPVGSSAATS